MSIKGIPKITVIKGNHFEQALAYDPTKTKKPYCNGGTMMGCFNLTGFSSGRDVS